MKQPGMPRHFNNCNCQWEFCCWNLMHLPVISGGCVVPAVQLSLRGVRSETRQLTIYTSPHPEAPLAWTTQSGRRCVIHISVLCSFYGSGLPWVRRGEDNCANILTGPHETVYDGYRLCFPLQNDNWSPWSLVMSIISSVISFTIQLNGSDRCYQTGSWLGWSGHARQHAGHVNIMG